MVQTVAAAIEEYRADAKMEKARSHTFDSQLNKLSFALGSYPLAQLTWDVLSAWSRDLLARYSRDYVATLVSYLRATLRHANRHHGTPVPPLPRIGDRRRRTGHFAPGEYERVRSFVKAGAVRDCLDFLAACGWRRSEPLTLTWDDVDFGRGVLTLPTSKTGVPGAIALVGTVREILTRRAADRNGAPWVFAEWGRPLNPRRVTETLKAACRAAGVPVRRPHDLRRTVARDLLAAGADVPTAMSLTRHRDVKVFLEHYAQTGLARVAAAQVALDNFRRGVTA